MDMFDQVDDLLSSTENELSTEAYYHRGYIQALKDAIFILSKYDIMLEDADRIIAEAGAIEEKEEADENHNWIDRFFGYDGRGMDKD